MLVFFGFTFCPDVCPTTIIDISGWLEELGDAGKSLRAAFITVDPERDTPNTMQAYLSNFHRRIIGFTGNLSTTAEVAKRLGAYFKKVPTADGEYKMEHTAFVFLFSSDGKFVSTIDYHEAPKTAVPKIKPILR